MKALALTGVGIGLCGVAALASPLVTLVLAGGRTRPATTTGPLLDDLVTAAERSRTERSRTERSRTERGPAESGRTDGGSRHDGDSASGNTAPHRSGGTPLPPGTAGTPSALPFIPAQRTRR
ncbi:hypothetical protein RM572_28250 [Streptomyces sp. DSM 42041]|uniref:Uncharacterized protein n=1 Tax=Streptomyces hazeniae TaxID=3075538 RepID=A0ABU2P072_9ACTN|nr:hypothetical protein [Streptomyces sp. DSM 42041]MDT0382647.1 hypothetical protein [Streptomyces sp. DSM 42041]